MLPDDEKVSNNEQLSTEFKDMIKIYNRSDKIGKIVILSLLSTGHGKQKIANWFNCFKRQIDKEWKLMKVSEGLAIPNTEI